MSDQPLLQFSTPIRRGEEPQVVLRLNDNADVETALAIINSVTEKLVPLAAGLVDVLSRALDGENQVTGQIQAAGLNPVPVAPQPAPPVQQYQPPVQPQPVYQAQAQASQAYAPPPQQYAPQPVAMAPANSTPLVGPCWAASPRKMHNSECKDCGAPTLLTVKTIRGDKTLNAHVCSVNPSHKVTWCEETIWNSKVVTANGQGIMTDPRLVTG